VINLVVIAVVPVVATIEMDKEAQREEREDTMILRLKLESSLVPVALPSSLQLNLLTITSPLLARKAKRQVPMVSHTAR